MLILLLAMACLVGTGALRLSFQPRQHMLCFSARVYDAEMDLKKLVSQSEMIIVVPTSTTRANEIAELRKSLPPTCEASIVPSFKMLDAVDSTPHVQLQEMSGSNFVVFVPSDDGTVYELFLKWVRQVSKDAEGAVAVDVDSDTARPPPPQFLVCRKGTLLRLNR